MTVIDSVLKMRNAPDEQGDRRDQRGRRPEVGGRAAQRGGDVAPATTGRTARLVSATLERGRDLGRRRALADDDVDPADARRRRRGACAVCERDDDRPPAGADERPVAGEDPDDRQVDRSAGALERDRRAEGEAVLGGEALGDERLGRVGAGQRARRRRAARSRTRGSRTGSMPRTVTGAGRRRRVVDRRREVGPSLEGRCRDGDARRALDRGEARRRTGPVLAERRDPQVGPADEVADGPRRSTPRSRRRSPATANRTPTPRAIPTTDRTVRPRRAREAPDARGDQRRRRRTPTGPSSARRAMSGVGVVDRRAGRGRSRRGSARRR